MIQLPEITIQLRLNEHIGRTLLYLPTVCLISKFAMQTYWIMDSQKTTIILVIVVEW